jgi:aminodeoxyfutalosine deaminase
VADTLSPGREWSLTARWVFPVDGPPLERGCIAIQGDGIVAVEAHGRRRADVDLGNVAVLPGFVNAHTHLDLTGLRGLAPPSADFTAWLRTVIGHRRERTSAQVKVDVRTGLAESLACGTTLLGDIAGMGLSWPALAKAPLRSVVFYELLGLPRDRAAEAWDAALPWLEGHPATATCRPGLSPHAPYSVRAALFRAAAELAHRHGLPLAIHLAETKDELTLLQSHDGPFVAFLTSLGVWKPQGLVGSAEEVIDLNGEVPRVLFAHGNYLNPAAPVPSGGSIVYCPRTHAAFGHAPHPFRHFLARGVRVALGTDSLASNPDLSVLNEARFLHQQHPDVPGSVLLRMATLAGAEALGWHDETGSLTPGKSADLVVLPLPPDDAADPHRLVFASNLPVQAVLCRGQWVSPAPSLGP